jgi:hypothetical protein
MYAVHAGGGMHMVEYAGDPLLPKFCLPMVNCSLKILNVKFQKDTMSKF